jgi:hypothetical protein
MMRLPSTRFAGSAGRAAGVVVVVAVAVGSLSPLLQPLIMSDKNIRQANDRFMVLHRNSAACSMPMQPAKEIQL